jgi:osmotically-inducible protein OsmY
MNQGYSNSKIQDDSGKSLLEKSASLVRNEDHVHPRGGGSLTKFGVYSSDDTAPPKQLAHFGKGPKGYQRTDTRIEEEVCERLTRDPHVDASEIEISVRDGEVTLSGSVSDRQQKYRAEDIVEHVLGVKETHSRIRVQRSGRSIPHDLL